MKDTVQRGSKASQRAIAHTRHASASSPPSTAKASAPVDRCVPWLGLWATATVVEWTGVVGTPAVLGWVGVGAGVVGTVVVGVVAGATVPGWAPLAGVVVVGAVEAGVVVAGAGVLEVVVPWTRAEAGMGILIPKARPVVVVVLAPKAAAGAAARTQHKVTTHRERAHMRAEPGRRTITPTHANGALYARGNRSSTSARARSRTRSGGCSASIARIRAGSAAASRS
jgi:hypothetical protein